MPQMTLEKRRAQAQLILDLIAKGEKPSRIPEIAKCSWSTLQKITNSRENCYICGLPSELNRRVCKKHLKWDIFIRGEFPPIVLIISCDKCQDQLVFDGEFKVKCPNGHPQDEKFDLLIRKLIEGLR